MKTYKQLLEENKSNKSLSQVEELDEIKLATVGKIIKHSPKIASAAIGAAVAAHSVDVPKQPVKASYSEFTKKIQKEEVELTEGKIPVEHAANSVGKVLGQHNAVKFLAHLKPGTEKHTSWDKINTALKSQGVQTHHIAKIAGHIKPVQFKEEVESLDELSKKTLGSYVKKATGGLNGVAHHAFNANEKIGCDSDDRAKSYSKAVKRIKGIEQATDKLTKEEVESLDEGSFKYHMDKAVAADARGDTKNKEYHLSHAKTARYAVPTAAYPKHKELFDKYKKMTEEVELDEVLDPSMGAGEYVKDFQKSDAPQFKGKSQEKRRIMGIAAYMAAKREKNK